LSYKQLCKVNNLLTIFQIFPQLYALYISFFYLFWLSIANNKHINDLKMKNIAIFASGNGSNAENITNYFANNSDIMVACFLCNNPKAGVIARAERLGIPCLVFSRDDINNSSLVIDFLRQHDIYYIVLGGFLWLLPSSLTDIYNERIVNIHPSLLPKYGGKGMYGDKVHEAVIAAGEKESGITIHRINEKYDDGAIICQKTCPVLPDDTPDTLASRVHALEYEWFPKVIEQDILALSSL
jgi:phosphoribosylglycinamide formyltransferase-1